MVVSKMTFGEKVRLRRALEGLTQDELADIIGVCKTTICRWERGHHGPATYCSYYPRLKEWMERGVGL